MLHSDSVRDLGIKNFVWSWPVQDIPDSQGLRVRLFKIGKKKSKSMKSSPNSN